MVFEGARKIASGALKSNALFKIWLCGLVMEGLTMIGLRGFAPIGHAKA